MPNRPPGSHRASISVNLIGHNFRMNLSGPSFRSIVGTAPDDEIQEVLSELEMADHWHGRDRAGVSVTIDYDMREHANDNAVVQNVQMFLIRNAEALRRNGFGRLTVNANLRDTQQVQQQCRPDTQQVQQQNRPGRPTLFSAAAKLLGFLPAVNVGALSEDKRSCPICTEHFSAADKPILIKCNHVVGRACIEQWILSGHNSCPLCRATIFEPAA